jgi:hypothetical protein
VQAHVDDLLGPVEFWFGRDERPTILIYLFDRHPLLSLLFVFDRSVLSLGYFCRLEKRI